MTRPLEHLENSIRQELLLQDGDMGLFDQIEQVCLGPQKFELIFRVLTDNQIHLRDAYLERVASMACSLEDAIDLILTRMDQDRFADGVASRLLPKLLDGIALYYRELSDTLLDKVCGWFVRNPDRIPFFRSTMEVLLLAGKEEIQPPLENQAPDLLVRYTEGSVRRYGVSMLSLEADYLRGGEEDRKEARRILLEKFPSASPREKEKIFWILSKVSDPDTELHHLARSNMEIRHAGELYLATIPEEGEEFFSQDD